MELSDLFVVRRSKTVAVTAPQIPGARGAQDLAGAAPAGGAVVETAAGAFITPQSLITFPGACAAVIAITTAAQKLLGVPAHSAVAPFMISLLTGAIVFLINISPKDARPRGPVAWIVAAAIAFVNSLVLFTSALAVT